MKETCCWLKHAKVSLNHYMRVPHDFRITRIIEEIIKVKGHVLAFLQNEY